MSRRVGSRPRCRTLRLEPLEDRLLLAAWQPVAEPAAPREEKVWSAPTPTGQEKQPAPTIPAQTDEGDDGDDSQYADSPTPPTTASSPAPDAPTQTAQTPATQQTPPPDAPIQTAPDLAATYPALRTNSPRPTYESQPPATTPVRATAPASTATYDDAVTLWSRQKALALTAGSQGKVIVQEAAPAPAVPTFVSAVLPPSLPAPAPAPAGGPSLPHVHVPSPESLPGPEEGVVPPSDADEQEPPAGPPQTDAQPDVADRPLEFPLPGTANNWQQAARRFLDVLDSLGTQEAERGPAWVRLAAWAVAAASSAVLYEVVRQQLRRPRTDDELDLPRPTPRLR